jgi:PAS domain S-box-containing protein
VSTPASKPEAFVSQSPAPRPAVPGWSDKLDSDERAALTLAAIVQSSDDAIVSKDLNGIVQSWNPGATRLFGYEPDEIIGKSIKTIIPPERHHEEDLVLSRIRSGQRIDHFETVRVRKDGKHLHISLTVSPIIDRFGNVIGASKIARDISSRVEAEDALRRSTAIKDEFLSMVSHELRTPIAVILGNSHVLKKRAAELSEHDRTQAITDIAFEAERLQRIIENLLLLTRVEGGEKLEIELLHLERVAQQAIETCRRRSPFRKIECNIQGKVPPALGESTLTALVFENLISNADKYSPEDEAIEVRLQVNEAGTAEVHVLDRGIGLAPEDIDELFAPFYRASTAKDRSFGMGLGLAVCKKAIEEQGGAIGAVQRPGGGSDFWFTLPLAPEAEYD